jgi:glycosyltransferase involved in cell wall biosynthesis
MKVLHTVHGISRSSGGVSHAVIELIKTMSRSVEKVQLYSSTSITDPFLIEAVNPYVYSDAQLDLSSFNVIHDHGIWLPFNHKIASSSNRQRVARIVSPHGMLEKWAFQHKGIKKAIAWQLYQKKDISSATAIHCTSRMELETLRELNSSTPIALIPFGMDVPTYSVKKKQNKNYILFLSRIHEKKGLLSLVRAWSRIRNEDWKIVIAGPNENGHLHEVQKLVNELSLNEFFEFPGEVYGPDKENLFRNADLFVLPTFSENFGFVIAEALSYGVPVITTKGAPWEELRIHNCGWWIDIGVDPLESALQDAINRTKQSLEEMGKNGIKLITEKYSWSICAEKMLLLYDWANGAKVDLNFLENAR